MKHVWLDNSLPYFQVEDRLLNWFCGKADRRPEVCCGVSFVAFWVVWLAPRWKDGGDLPVAEVITAVWTSKLRPQRSSKRTSNANSLLLWAGLSCDKSFKSLYYECVRLNNLVHIYLKNGDASEWKTAQPTWRLVLNCEQTSIVFIQVFLCELFNNLH